MSVNKSNGHLLITGANGFVGRALCNEANKLGFQVKALTRNPHDFIGTIQNIICSNLGEVDLVFEAMRHVDVVVHLAARVHVMNERSGDTIAAYRNVNLDLTLNLARQAAAAGVRRFIYLSSIKVNGEKTEKGFAFTADDVPAPEDPYGISKMEAENALLDLSKITGMEVVIIRPPLIYGPGVGANFLSMMRWLSRKVPLPLGAIHNRRSMVALENLLSLIITCVDHPRAAGQIFLVSDDEDISLTQLLRKLSKAMKTSSFLIPIPASIIKVVAAIFGKPAISQRLCGNLQVDIRKTKALLDWNPPLKLDEGIKLTADWYLSR